MIYNFLMQITAIYINRKAYKTGLPITKKAGVEHKINFIESPALLILDKLLENVKIKDIEFILPLSNFQVLEIGSSASCFVQKEGSFDFALLMGTRATTGTTTRG